MSKVLVDLDNTKTVNLHKNYTTQSRCQFKEGVPSVQFLFSAGNNRNSEPAQVHTLYRRDRAGDAPPPPLFRMAIFFFTLVTQICHLAHKQGLVICQY